ncbi:sugar phosphate isomerase/epimerase [Rugosimonospora acidiphila]|uniref:Sugar phosphate isomerase/epimerase n=1 Tax=Rugosimonospora acidiphila TaxID=556531 RepID=A0ABP9RRG0_9ACTN
MSQQRIAAAPISWGVCEVPGWGYQLPVERVLAEMRQVGVTATEFGPDGFLPDAPADKSALLGSYGLSAVGGFVPVVLHDPAQDPMPEVDRTLRTFLAADAGMVVLAAVSGLDGYDTRPELDEAGWRTLLSRLDRIAAAGAEVGLRVTLHPHVGTMVETRDEVHRVLDGSAVGLTLDTGHLLIGGTDPAELARQVPDRIGHTHLKDVDADWAARVRSGQASYTDAVRAGMYRPLGQGDIDIAGIWSSLESSGYTGWYVMEQDTILSAEPEGEGPLADVKASVAYLRGLS